MLLDFKIKYISHKFNTYTTASVEEGETVVRMYCMREKSKFKLIF